MSEPLRSHLLARWLLDLPDIPVLIETEKLIAPLVAVTQDCFDEDDGWVVVLVADLSDDS